LPPPGLWRQHEETTSLLYSVALQAVPHHYTATALPLLLPPPTAHCRTLYPCVPSPPPHACPACPRTPTHHHHSLCFQPTPTQRASNLCLLPPTLRTLHSFRCGGSLNGLLTGGICSSFYLPTFCGLLSPDCNAAVATAPQLHTHAHAARARSPALPACLPALRTRRARTRAHAGSASRHARVATCFSAMRHQQPTHLLPTRRAGATFHTALALLAMPRRAYTTPDARLLATLPTSGALLRMQRHRRACVMARYVARHIHCAHGATRTRCGPPPANAQTPSAADITRIGLACAPTHMTPAANVER